MSFSGRMWVISPRGLTKGGKLEQWIEIVVNAVGDRLGGNNHRNNSQERALEQVNATIMGLNGKMEQNRKDTQQIHEKQIHMAQRMEEENNHLSDEIKKSIDSVTQQEEKMFERGRYDQTMAPHVSRLGGKKGVKGKRTSRNKLRGRPTDFWTNSEDNTRTLTTARTEYRFNND